MSQQAISGSVEEIRAWRDAIYTRGFVEGTNGRRTDLWPVSVQRPAGEFLRDLVVREGASHCLETGLGLGMSALFIAEGLMMSAASREASGSCSHTIVEPNPEFYDHAGVNAVMQGPAGVFATIIREDSTLALPRLVSDGRRFDFAYIDGCHIFEYPFIDIFFALRLVKPEGLIVVDDHWMPSVQTVLGFYHRNRDVKLELYEPTGPGKRFVGLRVPKEPDYRLWDHFVEFSAETLPAYPWRRSGSKKSA